MAKLTRTGCPEVALPCHTSRSNVASVTSCEVALVAALENCQSGASVTSKRALDKSRGGSTSIVTSRACLLLDATSTPFSGALVRAVRIFRLELDAAVSLAESALLLAAALLADAALRLP